MKRRLAVLTEIIAPYRIPVFNALALHPDIDLHVIFLSETDPSLRQWHVYKDEIKFSYEVLPGWRRRIGKYNFLLNWNIGKSLQRAQPEAIVSGGYSYLAAWCAAAWAREHAVPLLLWSESTAVDARRQHLPVEAMKRRFSKLCSAFVVPGAAARSYLISLGASESAIFIAPNAVDVRFYSGAAARARQHAAEIRSRYGLPPRYFLFVGRLVKEKGVFDLLKAYSGLGDPTRSQVGLVFVGDGPARSDLSRRAAEVRSGIVKFIGWLHREQIPEIYALADALVLPTYSDTWGFVVNEAMACGLPIIVSEAAGCVPDLVEKGANGFPLPVGDVEALTRAMQSSSNDPGLRSRMGAQSGERIHDYTPDACAEGMAKAVKLACGAMV
jgi:glycosyltransferase involved in cell wall biosynthesis